MNDIQIFKNEQFGEVRIVMNESNEPLFCAKDVAVAFITKSLDCFHPDLQ